MNSTRSDSAIQDESGCTSFLVVDDDPMVRKIVTRGLSQLDPGEVLEAEDGLVAKDILSQRSVDVVITDVVMPNMDGLELMKWAQEHRPGPLWIVLSGLETFDAAVDALQLGAFDYLAKPPEVARVRVAVRNALDQISLVRERERLYVELECSNTQLAEKVDQLQQVCRVLEDQAAVIQADLDRAEIIQRALLPQAPPAIQGWCMETLYRPGSSVGGDFYDAVLLGEDHLGLVIADAAGHGVAAAMLSVLFKLGLEQADSDGRVLKPREVMERLNNRLYVTTSAPGAFVTAVYILLDFRSGRMTLASAGHPPCIVSSPGGGQQLISRTGPALGLEPDASYTERECLLESGSRLMLYTDGVLEGGADSPSNEDIASALGSGAARDELLADLYQAATRGVSGDRDDITMLVLERCEGASHFDDAVSRKERQQPESPADLPQLAQGAEGGRAFLCLAGSVTWLCGQAIFDGADQLLSQYGNLVMDLGACEHMDSTCLGTLHQIVTSNPGRVSLQRVSGGVQALFDELSMRAVVGAISPEVKVLPRSLVPVDSVSLTPDQQGVRILTSHEALADLSDENREQFQAVVDSLRSDLQSGS